MGGCEWGGVGAVCSTVDDINPALPIYMESTIIPIVSGPYKVMLGVCIINSIQGI